MSRNGADADLIIIGAGQAGVPLAWGAASAGLSVILVEEGPVGGSCVNYGCTPTKAAIASARVAHQARRASEYGLDIPQVTVDYREVIARAKRIAAASRDGMDASLADSANPRLIRGHARLDGAEGAAIRVTVEDASGATTELLTNDVVIDSGAKSTLPAIEGLDRIPYLHAGNWLELETLPEHLVIMGAGYIALEMGQLYRRLGSKVTIIGRSTRLVRREDEEVSAAIESFLADDGIELLHETRIEKVEAAPGGGPGASDTEGGGILLHLTGPDGPKALKASHLFLAVGREPNTDALGLEVLGVETGRAGAIKVDEKLRTNVPHVWAAGDARGGAMFTHTAWDDNRVLASQLYGDGSRTTDRIEPYAVFTDPELGRVGMTEAEARAAGHEVKVATFKMERSGKAFELGETKGFIKVVADAKDDRILGASLLCSEASELVHIFIDLMNAGVPYTIIREAVHIHPTLAEAVQSSVALL